MKKTWQLFVQPLRLIMLIKFFARGSNGGDAPVNYVMATENRENLPPVVLKNGNPDLTRDLINSIDRKWSYTSGVISFAIEDNPTEQQQLDVIERFEGVAFAGLEEDQYNILWVRHQHTEGNRVELHFVTPRMELESGKALNIAPPQWQKLFDPLQTALNIENNWADPHDPMRAQVISKVRESEPRAQTREEIGNFIHDLVESGKLRNRQEIITKLTEIGLKTHREGKDYISVKDAEDPEAKPFRLKGIYYERDWEAVEFNGENTAKFDRNGRGSGGDPRGVFDGDRKPDTRNLESANLSKQPDCAAVEQKLKEVIGILEREVAKRRDFHRQSYPTISIEHGQDFASLGIKNILDAGDGYSFGDSGNSIADNVLSNVGNERAKSSTGQVEFHHSSAKENDRGFENTDSNGERHPFDLTIPDPWNLFLQQFKYGAEIPSDERGRSRKMVVVQTERRASSVLPNQGAKVNDTTRTATFIRDRRDFKGFGEAFFRFKEWLRRRFMEFQRFLSEKFDQFLERERRFRERNEQFAIEVTRECDERTAVNVAASDTIRDQSEEIDHGVQQLQPVIAEINGSITAIAEKIKEIISPSKIEAELKADEPNYGGGMSM